MNANDDAAAPRAAGPVFRTCDDAWREIRRRKAEPKGGRMLYRCEKSPYGGGYRIRSIPVDLIEDAVLEPAIGGALGFFGTLAGYD